MQNFELRKKVYFFIWNNKFFISKANENVQEVEVIAFKFTDEDKLNCFILEGHILYCAKFPLPRVSDMFWYTINEQKSILCLCTYLLRYSEQWGALLVYISQVSEAALLTSWMKNTALKVDINWLLGNDAMKVDL